MPTTNLTIPAFQLKGSLFALTIMQIMQTDLGSFGLQLAKTVAQSPKFFQQAPLVLDVSGLNLPQHNLDLAELLKLIKQQGLIPVGIRGADTALQVKAMALGLAIFTHSGPAKDTVIQPESKPQRQATRLITQPVRSGQQIYAKDCDLIIMAAVSAGAEVLADGHIHIYGALRGRALAGINGDTNARIFCKSLQAELISIAGRYLVSEKLMRPRTNAWMQIYLEEEQLKVSAL